MFRYLIDVPHGYLSVDTPFSCGADCTISLEMCYWHTANGHRLVGLTWGDRGIGCLLFYDYNPQTRHMTPLPESPIKGFYDNPAMLNAHLPRQGKDIHIKPIWDNPSDTLTLRWNGRDAFIFDGAAERYRKPAKSNEVALFARAYFYQTPHMPDLSAMKDAPLYDAPNGIIIRRLTPAEQQDYLIMLTCVRGDWAEIAYIQPGDQHPVDLTRSLRQGRDYALRPDAPPLRRAHTRLAPPLCGGGHAKQRRGGARISPPGSPRRLGQGANGHHQLHRLDRIALSPGRLGQRLRILIPLHHG